MMLLPGLVNIQKVIENDHLVNLVRWFTHWKWWCSIVMLVYQRVYVIIVAVTDLFHCLLCHALSRFPGRLEIMTNSSKMGQRQFFEKVPYGHCCFFLPFQTMCLESCVSETMVVAFDISFSSLKILPSPGDDVSPILLIPPPWSPFLESPYS